MWPFFLIKLLIYRRSTRINRINKYQYFLAVAYATAVLFLGIVGIIRLYILHLKVDQNYGEGKCKQLVQMVK